MKGVGQQSLGFESLGVLRNDADFMAVSKGGFFV